MPSSEVVFVTGFPGFIGQRLVARMAEQRRGRASRWVILARPQNAAAARRSMAVLDVPFEVVEGDVRQMHLGLSGAEYKALSRDVTEIWHLAALSDLAAAPRDLRAVNVEGTRNVLELARGAARLRRLHHFSSANVSGTRQGVILEDELDVGQRFDEPYSRSKFEAEQLVRAARKDLPVVVYRPSMVVGDSRTGEIDRFEGPYFLAILLVATPLNVPLPIPPENGAPLNAVPVDFVVEAALAIGAHPEAAGRTVHLVDPAPLPVRRVYELIAARAGKSLPPLPLPSRAIAALLKLPLIEGLARPQRNAIQLVNRLAIYNCRNMLDLLAGTDIRCPPIASYLDRLVDHVRAHYAAPRPPALAEVEDPLA